MTVETKVAFCTERLVEVDLNREFHHCIEENQCFSDEPCPLSMHFDQTATQVELSASPGLKQQK